MWLANIFVQDFVGSITEKREQKVFCSKHIDLHPANVLTFQYPLKTTNNWLYVFRSYRNRILPSNCIEAYKYQNKQLSNYILIDIMHDRQLVVYLWYTTGIFKPFVSSVPILYSLKFAGAFGGKSESICLFCFQFSYFILSEAFRGYKIGPLTRHELNEKTRLFVMLHLP